MRRTPEEELQFKKDRQKYIGGSDIGALLGIAPPSWEVNTPVKLYLAKTEEPYVDPFEKPQLKRGKRWESVVAEMLVERLEDDGHKVKIFANNKHYRDKDVDHFRCEVDYELQIDDSEEIINCELKTVHPFLVREWGESDSDAAPIYYVGQGQWGLGVTGRRVCIIAALFGADDLRTFPLHRDDGLIETLRMKAHTFWNDHVLVRKPPPFQDVTDVNALYKLDKTVQRDFSESTPFRSAYANLVAADNELAAAKYKREQAEKQCKEFMGDTGVALLFGKQAITWKAHKRNAVDVEALRNLYPKVAQQCTSESTVRPFKLVRSKK